MEKPKVPDWVEEEINKAQERERKLIIESVDFRMMKQALTESESVEDILHTLIRYGVQPHANLIEELKENNKHAYLVSHSFLEEMEVRYSE